jgi:hypothetical protein
VKYLHTIRVEPLENGWREELNIAIEKGIRRIKGGQYEMQAVVSKTIGNTRIREPRDGKPLLSPASLEQIRSQVKPGDILLERQNWYMSRAFMPGFWAHAAIYVGTPEEIKRLGLEDHPWIKPHLAQFKAKSSKGKIYCILEAVPDGVRMTTLEDCMGIADSVAVLRPKISEEQIREAIAKGFSHLGKAYDFEFDFFTTDKLVCTELVYRCVQPSIRFDLVEVLGRKTLPPTEMARKFATEMQSKKPELDLVLFFEGNEIKGIAEQKNAAAFADTVNRPSLTWLQPLE